MSMLPVEHKCAECLNESCLPVEFRGVKPLCAECCDRYDADQRERLSIGDEARESNRQRMELGKQLWSEDDALPRDRERLEGAWLRLFGVPYDRAKAVETEDSGDALFLRMPNGAVACESYPGNSAICAGENPICRGCGYVSGTIPHPKYCEAVRGGDPDGKNPHSFVRPAPGDSVDDVSGTGTPSEEAVLDFIFAFNDELVAAFGPGEITFHVNATADGDGSLY